MRVKTYKEPSLCRYFHPARGGEGPLGIHSDSKSLVIFDGSPRLAPDMVSLITPVMGYVSAVVLLQNQQWSPNGLSLRVKLDNDFGSLILPLAARQPAAARS